jgi:hypothetical protein
VDADRAPALGVVVLALDDGQGAALVPYLGDGERLAHVREADKYPEFFANFPKAEQSAIMLRAYEERVIHGLFQTEAYARGLLNDDDAVKTSGFLAVRDSKDPSGPVLVASRSGPSAEAKSLPSKSAPSGTSISSFVRLLRRYG